MGKIEKLRLVDPVLSSLALGYSNHEYIADRLFPEVVVEKEYGKAREFTQELFDFYEAERGLGADTNIILPEDHGSFDFVLGEKDLAIPIDYREQGEVSDFNLLQTRTFELSERMKVRREKVVATLAQDPAKYTNGNTSTPATKWNVSTSTPIKDINAAIDVIANNCGKAPNTIEFGLPTWTAIKNHSDFLNRLANTKTGVVTPQLVAEILELEHVLIGRALWRDPVTKVKANVWTDNAILAYVAPGTRDQRSIRTPGFGYTIVKKGWAPIDTYQNVGNKVTYVRYTTLEASILPGNIAGYLIEDTNS